MQHRPPVDIEHRKAEILAALDAGRTMQEVADSEGIGRMTLHRRLKAWGIQRERIVRRGPEHPFWKGGRYPDGTGYIRLTIPGRRRIREHRVVAEQMLGRSLLPGEVVHHRNGDRSDNRPENLQVFASNGEHLRHELTGRRKKR